MPSFLELFTGVAKPAPAAPAVGAAPEGAAPVANDPNAMAPGTKPLDPNAQAPTGTKPPADSPPTKFLDDNIKLWETIASGTGAPTLKVDPAAIAEAAKGLNFTRLVDPELLTKAVGGNGEALLQVVNAAVQQGFALAMQGSTALMDRHGNSIIGHVEKGIPDRVRQLQANEGLITGNPNFSHPAVKPLVSVIQAQFANTYPNATAAELQKHAETYLKTVAGFITATEAAKPTATGAPGSSLTEAEKQQMEQRKQQAEGTFDWDKFMSNSIGVPAARN